MIREASGHQRTQAPVPLGIFPLHSPIRKKCRKYFTFPTLFLVFLCVLNLLSDIVVDEGLKNSHSCTSDTLGNCLSVLEENKSRDAADIE